MLAQQRQTMILEVVRENGAARVADLVAQFGVSDMTIRRDLDVLARRGWLDKVHGGATMPLAGSTDEPGFAEKSLRELAEKQGIAHTAAALVRPGQAVGLSAGTTTWTLAQALLDVAGLTGAVDRPVGRYSLGMRQRLGLATALLGDPAVVVLDEPANGLDPAGVTRVRRLLRVCADEGRTVLVSSHVLAEVAQVVDRVVIIRDGALATETNVGDLSAARVMVRVDRLAVFVEALRARCVEFELLDGDVISVSIADPAEVGRLAAEAGVVVIELGRRNAGASLEAMFLAATGGAR